MQYMKVVRVGLSNRPGMQHSALPTTEWPQQQVCNTVLCFALRMVLSLPGALVMLTVVTIVVTKYSVSYRLRGRV
jgi:hypothetical protein